MKRKRMQLLLSFFCLYAGILLSGPLSSGWRPLFNGENLENWRHYLARPDSSVDVPGFQKNEFGEYAAPLGYMSEDPLQVFSVVFEEGIPMIRISGQIIGNLFIEEAFSNYHLKLKFKWGNIKWPWMQGRPRDGGILYHYHRSRSGKNVRHEFQIHEGDVGSYWARQTAVSIPAVMSPDIPESIQKARPFLAPFVSTLGDTMLMFQPDASWHRFTGKDEWQICIARPNCEKPPGQWNELELICWKNHALHRVNGCLNMVILNAMAQGESMDHGMIQLQSEGAEIYFKDIQIRGISKMPADLHQYLSNSGCQHKSMPDSTGSGH